MCFEVDCYTVTLYGDNGDGWYSEYQLRALVDNSYRVIL